MVLYIQDLGFNIMLHTTHTPPTSLHFCKCLLLRWHVEELDWPLSFGCVYLRFWISSDCITPPDNPPPPFMFNSPQPTAGYLQMFAKRIAQWLHWPCVGVLDWHPSDGGIYLRFIFPSSSLPRTGEARFSKLRPSIAVLPRKVKRSKTEGSTSKLSNTV
jgi:hypothetical protein